MDRRLVLPLLAAAAIVFACGPRQYGRGEAHATVRQSSAVPLAKPGKAPAAVRPHRKQPDAPAIEAALTVQTETGAPRFALTVANTSDHRVELAFPDGRTRDFAVFDAVGREVWRWSRGRLFTQGMQVTLVAPGDSVTYAERWTPPAPGRYTVVAQLRSENFPIERRATFAFPGDTSAAPTPASEAVR